MSQRGKSMSKSPPPSYDSVARARDPGSGQIIGRTADIITNGEITGQQRSSGLPIIRKFAYGVGHVFNDMCASMWFTYLVLFYHKVVLLGNVYAGMLILIGQVADALATPVIGFLVDKIHVRYGRRKFCHLIGTAMVTVSLFFIWHNCLFCLGHYLSSHLWFKMLYFAIPIIIFQFGWASVQISHLSLIPELTDDKNERVGLNAIRYAFTILSNIGVYTAMLLLLLFIKGSPNDKLTSMNLWIFASGNETEPAEDEISPEDVWIFSGTALGVIGVGLVFSAIFQIGTREPYLKPEERVLQYSEGRKIKWYLWFSVPRFYAVAVIYMCTRLMNNIIQAYTPLYLLETLHLSKISVGVGPLVIFVGGLLMTLLLKVLNRVVGRYLVYFLGIALIWGGLIWFYALDQPHSTVAKVAVYGPTLLVGAGGATVLVTSLSMVADLIDNATGSAAFVYGLMSFTDKLSSGIVIQIIQALHPCKEHICCSACTTYYRTVLVFVPAAATVVAVIALVVLLFLIFLKKRQSQQLLTITAHDQYSRASSINPGGPVPPARNASPLRPPILDEPGFNEKAPLLSPSNAQTQ